jgi:xanthine dehydrogenase YagR molybdenum-binding subunit
VIPVHADMGAMTVDFIDVPDTKLNTTGVKGLGEVVCVGAAASIANAVFHATGQRFRKLPIRIDDLFAATAGSAR